MHRQPALLHGDYYPGSWLRCGPTDIKIIDPEFAFVGPPEFDVGVLIAHCTFVGLHSDVLAGTLRRYRSPDRFSLPLAYAFAGIEVMRRLLGVAQLPLNADLKSKNAWLSTARRWVLSA